MAIFKLRPYQVEGIEACMSIMTSSRKKSIVVAPTGAGKSHYISETVKRLKDIPIVILQPSKELLKQNYSKYVKAGGKASIYCASLKTKTVKKVDYTEIDGELKKCREVSRITYATIGSIKKDIDKLIKLGVKHVIVDEVHLQSKVGSQMRDFLKKLKATNVLGLTATPIYLQGGMNGSRLVMINRTFATIFPSISHVTQIKELVDSKFWTPFIYKIIKTDDSQLKLNTSGSDYTEYSQKLYYKSNNLQEQIVEEVKKLKAEGRKRILVFVPSIEEANNLYGLIPNSAVVHSKLSTQERDLMIDEFTNGDIPVAINVNVLATGYDNPEIDAIITSRPTSSIALFYQQIGRGCRLHPDKKDCIITDFSGNTERFGRVEDLTFEEIPHYGWGMWNGNGQLLSDYPIMTEIKPTKDSLIQAIKDEEELKRRIEENRNKPQESKLKDYVRHLGKDGTPIFTFGKYNGKTVAQVQKENEGYLTWIVEQYRKGEWNFYGVKGTILKNGIQKALRLPSLDPTEPPKPRLPF